MTKDPERRWGGHAKSSSTRPPTHPGEMLQEEFLRPQQLDPRAVAPRVGILTGQLLDLLDGRARVTPDLAEKLAREFKTSAELWLNLQAEWDAWAQRNDPS